METPFATAQSMLEALRTKLFAEHPSFGQIDHAPGSIPAAFDLSGLGAAGELSDAPLRSPIAAFHLTNRGGGRTCNRHANQR